MIAALKVNFAKNGPAAASVVIMQTNAYGVDAELTGDATLAAAATGVKVVATSTFGTEFVWAVTVS